MKPIELPRAEAENLYRNYGLGVEEGGKIIAHPLEVLYFMEKGKLKLEGEDFRSLMEKAKAEDPLAEEKYAVLKQLRRNGYITRQSFTAEPWMRVYRKGFRPGEDRTQYLLKVVQQGWAASVGELEADMKKAAEVRKELVYAIPKEGKIVFFKTVRTSFD